MTFDVEKDLLCKREPHSPSEQRATSHGSHNIHNIHNTRKVEPHDGHVNGRAPNYGNGDHQEYQDAPGASASPHHPSAPQPDPLKNCSHADLHNQNTPRAIFIGNFSQTTQSSDLEHVFSVHGTVHRIDLKRNFAFVFMESEHDGCEAIAALNGVIHPQITERPLKVEWARGDGIVKRREDERRRLALSPSDTLFVVNFDPSTTGSHDLHSKFSPFGRIIRLDLQQRFAFIQYEIVDQATAAMNALNGAIIDGRKLIVEYTVHQSHSRRPLPPRHYPYEFYPPPHHYSPPSRYHYPAPPASDSYHYHYHGDPYIGVRRPPPYTRGRSYYGPSFPPFGGSHDRGYSHSFRQRPRHYSSMDYSRTRSPPGHIYHDRSFDYSQNSQEHPLPIDSHKNVEDNRDHHDRISNENGCRENGEYLDDEQTKANDGNLKRESDQGCVTEGREDLKTVNPDYSRDVSRDESNRFISCDSDRVDGNSAPQNGKEAHNGSRSHEVSGGDNSEGGRRRQSYSRSPSPHSKRTKHSITKSILMDHFQSVDRT